VYSKFFGKQSGGNKPAPQQSKLAFSSSAESKEKKAKFEENGRDEDEEMAGAENDEEGKSPSPFMRAVHAVYVQP
jgi:hypothetical protein